MASSEAVTVTKTKSKVMRAITVGDYLIQSDEDLNQMVVSAEPELRSLEKWLEADVANRGQIQTEFGA